MKLEAVATALKCLPCGGADVTIGAAAVCTSCRQSIPINGANLIYSHAGHLSEGWEKMQAESVERYEHDSYEEDETLALLFGGFIGATVDREEIVLDIGCGITPELPIYIRDLGLKRYLGLEPLTKPVEREYPCLVGAVAEAIPLADRSIGAVVLATSIDHIEKIDEAVAEMKRVLRPGGSLYFWIGLYEPGIMAASKTFENIVVNGSPLKRALRIAAAYLEYAYLLYRMSKRRRQLARGERIDNAHCRYYTRASTAEAMTKWGLSVRRQVLVPGSASLFVEAVPH